MIYPALFLTFFQVGLFSIGGGYAAIPLIQNQVVFAHGWLTMDQFADLVTIAEMTPGPIAINAATFVGTHIAGIPGALISTFGCILPSVVIVSALSYLYTRLKTLSVLQNMLSGLRPAVVALIASAGLSILQLVLFKGRQMGFDHVQWISLGLFLVAFLLLRRLKWNPILVMSLCGAAALGLYVTLGIS